MAATAGCSTDSRRLPAAHVIAQTLRRPANPRYPIVNTFNRCMFFPHLAHTFRVANPVTAHLPDDGLPKLLCERRKALRLKKRQVAEILGVHREMIGLWESGRHGPRVKYGPAIIRFLGGDDWLPMASLADRLRRFRTIRGWSQETLGVYLKCDERSVRDWESGKPPSPAQAAAVEARLPEIDAEL